MKITLPVSHVINRDNIEHVPNIDAYQVRTIDGYDKIPYGNYKEVIYHDSKGIVCNDFVDHFITLYIAVAHKKFKLYSTNLMPVSEEYSMIDGPSCKYYSCLNPLKPNELLKRVKYKLKYVRPFADMIALENGNKYPYYDYEYIFNPKWLKIALKELDVKFCFDIGHAIVSYNNYFFQKYSRIEDFILDHPLEDVVEVHLSRPDYSSESADITCYDMHEAPDYLEWKLLKLILPKLNNGVYIAIEYYREFDGMLKSYSNLFDIIRSIRQDMCKGRTILV
uniref:Xylose isomerase-like TIM barrel domain-containing protein n=1 Tax=viral metagenome TaxID=1070528 RepID=A0A6M3JTJ9_9ZZZZ